MRYYLIAGEASGDLHASHLMRALKEIDSEARFRFYGGDKMGAVSSGLVQHYRSLAYMGFIPVLLHLPTILRKLSACKEDIKRWQPDCVILVDYPGFNLRIAKFVKTKTSIPVYYYIAPKIWAWKEYRIKSLRRYVDEVFSILPFEVDYFEKRHNYTVNYVGNPTGNEVRAFMSHKLSPEGLSLRQGDRPVIALLAGSRYQEIKDNLPVMLKAVAPYTDRYQVVVAGAPGIERNIYQHFIGKADVQLVDNQTYALLSKAHAALVTSGTATLETALFRVPQVVCYKLPLPWLLSLVRKLVLKVKYISLVNLIVNRSVVAELVGDTLTVKNLRHELDLILDHDYREKMLLSYDAVWRLIGDKNAPKHTASMIISLLRKR